MDSYSPPYTLTDSILSEVAAISELLGRLSVAPVDAHPQLRRNNRIRSVHASLRIEAVSLSEGEVRALLDGKEVIGPEKELREVSNAFAAYDELERLDPYSLSELKRLHGIMTAGLVGESGVFRSGNEGVFDGERCIFMAPPPGMVSPLMEALFAWLRGSRGQVHPLVASCVFHYEFVFIHPFQDGNGRMARLWQTALLSSWNPIFRMLPMESRIEQCQQDYYDAISLCHRQGQSTAFIEFLLPRIRESLRALLVQTTGESSGDAYVDRLLGLMEQGRSYSAAELLSLLGLKSREALRRSYLHPAISRGVVAPELPDKPSSRNQRYRKI